MATTGMKRIEVVKKLKKSTLRKSKFDLMIPSINIKNLNMKTKQLTPYAHYQNTEE